MSALFSNIYSESEVNQPSKFEVFYSSSRPGAGKTEWAVERMANIETKWLYVVDRRDVIADRIKRIRKISQDVTINEIHSEHVASRIRSWNYDAANDDDHQVLIITHEGLMISDLSSYAGWSIIIDEVLDPWMYDDVKSTLTADVFSELFTINDRYLTIRKNTTPSKLMSDTALNDQMPKLYNAAKRGQVIVTIDDFSVDRSWQWFSIWNFDQLKVFDVRYVMANSFSESLMYKLMMATGGFVFKEIDLPETAYEPRRVIIRYFDHENRACQSFFKSNTGKQALTAIWAYYEKMPPDRVWTKNNQNMNNLNCHGSRLNPKVSGSNSYKNYTKATIIYSAKPSAQEQRMIDLFEIDVDEVIRARELETIIQFVTRTSIREPDDARTCEFDVYDAGQAADLKAYLDGLDIGLVVTLAYIDLGIKKREVRQNGRPSTGTAKTGAERKRKFDERKRLEKTLKRLGRN